MKVEFNTNIIRCLEVESTNSYAIGLLQNNQIKNFTVVVADFQSKGKGQRSNSWHSEKSSNLLLSLIIKHRINISNQFNLNVLISLSIIDLLNQVGIHNISIKWPNDILIDNKKIAGILIENKIKGSEIINSVIGIGLNVNQKKFPKFQREATSIKNEIFVESKINSILHSLLLCIEKRYSEYIISDNSIIEEYLDHLYLRNKLASFEINGERIVGRILSVSKNGKLLVELNDENKEFGLQEIKFLS